MKHLASIQKQFAAYSRDFNIVKIAIESDWWKKLTPEQQKQYILEHRRSKMRPNRAHWSPDTRHPGYAILSESPFMKKVLTSVPKIWKKTLVQQGIGANSSLRQLPDMLRSKVLKEAFEDKSVRAIVGFERSSPASMKPAFMIMPSGWKEDKFTLRVVKNKDGTPANPEDLAFIPKERVRRSRRDWRHSTWTERITDIRMSAVIDKIQDLPYEVFAVAQDPKRLELRQERKSLQEVSKRRDIEKALVAKTIRPVYDYYSSVIQRNTAKLQDASVPTFDEIVSPNYRSSGLARKQDQFSVITARIKDAQDKISSLGRSVDSIVSYHNLPEVEKPIGGEWEKRKVSEFMRELKELKTRYSEDYARAVELKKDFAITALTKTLELGVPLDYEDAYDQMMSIGQSDIAKEILSLRNVQGDTAAHASRLMAIIHKINAIH